MADLPGIGNGLGSVKIAVYATLMYDVISATNSSPQTTEINAAKRADTLMKWVKLGLLQGFLFVGIGAWVEHKTGGDPLAPVVGGGLAAALLWAQYVHARNSGLAKAGPGTEQY
jgi:hypothetical protein